MKRWFGPKVFGWGASPASWEGWLATGLFVAAMGLLTRVPGITSTGLLVGVVGLIGLFLMLVAVTYGPDEAPAATPRARLTAVWIAYLAAIAGVSAWGWSRLAGKPLAVWWDAGGTAEAFAPGAQVLLAIPLAAALGVAFIAVASGGGRARGGAMVASIVLLSGLLLLHLAYVAAQLGVLT